MRSTTAAALTLVSGAHAFWRMPCRSETGLARMDPIMDKGTISDHVHTIAGSGNFAMDATYEDLTAEGACTSCAVTQDKSAYWTPALYFVYSNGSSVIVPQVGGLLAYYLYYMDNVQAFPEGFQMVAGNKNLRAFNGSFPDEPLSSWPQEPTDQKWLSQRALGFNCLNYPLNKPEPSLYRHELPSKSFMDQNCPDGMRLEIGFPSCGTGEPDSDDHQSHVAYPNLVKEGKCPEGYDVNYPFLFFETIWATNAFKNEDGEFALSHGDPTGSGYHGDFIMGWESQDFLQNALDTCQNDSGLIEDCPLFNIQSDSEASKCAFEVPEVLVDENVIYENEGIPKGVPMQYGPEDATPYPCWGKDAVATSSSSKPSKSASASSSASDYGILDKASSAIFGENKQHSYSASSAQASSASAYSESSSASDENVAAASITASPSIDDAADNSEGKIVSTKYVTENGEVLEIAIEEVDVTVTATASQGADDKYRRHLHNHKRHGGARL